MQNKEIILTREQAKNFAASLTDLLGNVGLYEIKMIVTDQKIELIPHLVTREVKL